MRIKHKDSKKEHIRTSIPLFTWHKEYYANKKYLNYEFYDVPEIFDLYEINEKNGETNYLMSDFANVIFPKVKENPKKFVYKTHDPKYLDEYLMPRKIDYSNLSFGKRILKRITQIIRPKSNPNKIPFNRFERMSIVIGVLAIVATITVPIILFFLERNLNKG